MSDTGVSSPDDKIQENTRQRGEYHQLPQPTLADKVAFLLQPDAYAHPVEKVASRETHMSFIFLAGDYVYKLKKPVQFSYLDFSTLVRREKACNAEFTLNRRLAPDVYLGVIALVQTEDSLKLDSTGDVVDWLVKMRRLDEIHTLENALLTKSLRLSQIHRLTSTLRHFYRHADRVLTSGKPPVLAWQRCLSMNFQTLIDARLGLPAGLVRYVDRAQRRFLRDHAEIIEERARGRLVVDGHGDLRPEHIWLNAPIRVIDCLEFNEHLRAVDPCDEIAHLCIECERLGHSWASQVISRDMFSGMRCNVPPNLFSFYRCHRATLRARLAIAHLAEPNPRTPEKWLPLARSYLAIAAADARHLEHSLDSHKRPRIAQDQRHHHHFGHAPLRSLGRTRDVQASPDCDRRI